MKIWELMIIGIVFLMAGMAALTGVIIWLLALYSDYVL